MNYHPIMGISIFIVSLLISFLIGIRYKRRKPSIVKHTSVVNINSIRHNKSIMSDIISPDAYWLEKD